MDFLSALKERNVNNNSYREILTFDENGEEIRILTNIFDIPAEEILELYRLRWKIELFFKWIKQNLKIKKWLGHNENAIKIQIYSALIAYIILALLKLELKVNIPMISLSRIIRGNLLENESIFSLLTG
ncbi:transposase [Anaerosalibacter massiliensis]|uniref:transposase n=1 Tax=Anaerosalibacter massiliensis TaxID=1347392 RepID=UPI00067915BD|nr:transposase [Anaerosalibacter massiliensis]